MRKNERERGKERKGVREDKRVRMREKVRGATEGRAGHRGSELVFHLGAAGCPNVKL